MRIRFWAALLACVVALGLPLQASASDRDGAVLAAKGIDLEGPNAAPDLIDDDTTPTIGDAASGTLAAPKARTGVQVNDPALDNIQFFPNALPQPQRPYELSIQSETSVAAFGSDLVAGFNNSADQPVTLTAQNTVAFQHRFLSGVGVSHDGGRSWTESSLPPTPGSPFTFGDPAVAVDRHGNFYYASLGATAAGQSDVFVGRSTDRGESFQPGTIVALDPGADKEWIAVGPDPLNPLRDNVYVTWTSFQFNAAGATTGSQLRLARSADGGQSWTQSTIFAPVADQFLSSFLQFSNPVVDPASGRLYVPFLHFGQADADFVKVLISDDGGLTFRFSRFDVPGAPEPTGFPNVTPGTLADCGVNGGFRTVLHTGPDLGGPAVTIGESVDVVTIGYYAQLADGRLRVDAVSAELGDSGNGVHLKGSASHLGPAFDLIPSNNPLPAFGASFTTNYDRTIRPCYDIGEYMSITRSGDGTVAVFGDNRNTWTSPPESPAAGTHTQPDVFAARMGSAG